MTQVFTELEMRNETCRLISGDSAKLQCPSVWEV